MSAAKTKSWKDGIPEKFYEPIGPRVGSRPPKRIKALCKRLKKIWLKNPSVSLSLLVGADLVCSDDEFFKDIERIYGR